MMDCARLGATLEKRESVCTRCTHIEVLHCNICNRSLYVSMLFFESILVSSMHVFSSILRITRSSGMPSAGRHTRNTYIYIIIYVFFYTYTYIVFQCNNLYCIHAIYFYININGQALSFSP